MWVFVQLFKDFVSLGYIPQSTVVESCVCQSQMINAEFSKRFISIRGKSSVRTLESTRAGSSTFVQKPLWCLIRILSVPVKPNITFAGAIWTFQGHCHSFWVTDTVAIRVKIVSHYFWKANTLECNFFYHVKDFIYRIIKTSLGTEHV